MVSDHQNDGYQICILHPKHYEKCLEEVSKAKDGRELAEDVDRAKDLLVGWGPTPSERSHTINLMFSIRQIRKIRGCEDLFELRFRGGKNVRVFFCVDDKRKIVCVVDCVDHKDKRRLQRKYRDLCRVCRSLKRGAIQCCEKL